MESPLLKQRTYYILQETGTGFHVRIMSSAVNFLTTLLVLGIEHRKLRAPEHRDNF